MIHTRVNAGVVTMQNNRIVISFPYDPKLIEVVRTISDRAWNHKQAPRVWSVPNSPWHCAEVIRVLTPVGFHIDQKIRDCADAKASKPNLRHLPKNLYSYQKDGVKFIYAAHGRALIADDMGLGKTAEALVFTQLISAEAERVLIVAPANVTYKWAEKEIPMWADGRSTQVVEGGKQPLGNAHFTIMSYKTMVMRYEELSTIPFDIVIFDEAHKLKSNKSQQNRVARKLVKGVPHVLLLTGTPFKNKRIELYQLLNIINPDQWSNVKDFGEKYCGGKLQAGHWVIPPDRETNTEELQERLSTIMLRRTKKQVAIDLPDLTRVSIPMHISNWKDYEQALADAKQKARTEGYKPGQKLVILNALRQVVGRGKVNDALELAEDVLENGNKVVLFAYHKEIVKMLIDGLLKMGVRSDAIGIINGDTKPHERYNLQENFLNESGWLQVMIITTAGAEGLDLFSSSHLIMVERLWTPADEEQIEARLHRNGQKNAVTAHYLIARGTVDEHMDEVVESKRKEFGHLVDTDEVVQEVWTRLFEKERSM